MRRGAPRRHGDISARSPYRPAMRLPFFLTFVALSACSTESSSPPPVLFDATTDTGTVQLDDRPDVLDTGSLDMSTPEVAPVADAPAMDRSKPAPDVATPVDASKDRPSPRDIPPPDVPPGECAEVERSCTTNADCAMCTPVRGMAWCCGRNAGRSFCMVPDANGFCAGVTITPTVQCADLSIVRCRNHADCAMCFPAASGEPWCCAASNGECGWSPGRRACP